MGENNPRITNAQLYEVVTTMQKQLNDLMSEKGYGGRLLSLEKDMAAVSKIASDTRETVYGNGKDGMKQDLASVKNTLRIVVALAKWLLSPVLGGLVAIVLGLVFGE